MAKPNKKPSQLREECEALLETGITCRDDYLDALKHLGALRVAIASLKSFVKNLTECEQRLSESAAAYAVDHKTAVDGGKGLTEIKPNIYRGQLTLDHRVYSLTVSPGPIKRMNGDNITSEFLRGLPQDWLKEKPELDTTAINRLGVSGEELFKHGLYRPEKRVWSVEDAPTAQAAQGVVE